jgi:hypothetical protein
VISIEAFASIKRFDLSSKKEGRIPKAIALAITF